MNDYLNDLNYVKDLTDLECYTDSILFKNFLTRSHEEKKELKLSKEINKKKYQISHMFNTKFGKNFLNQKPEALKIFEKRFAKFLFDPDSQFLSKFPGLRRKLRHEKKISEELLKTKIDIGSMVFYDLRGKNRRKTRNINNGKEKLLSISKNFSCTPVKDIVQNSFYKTKFWDKNAKRIKNFFKNKLGKYNESFIEEKDEFKDNNIDSENEDNNSSKDLMTKETNTQREKGNLKLNAINNNLKNKTYNITNIKINKTISNKIKNDTIMKNNYTLNNNFEFGYYKSNAFNNIKKKENSTLNLKINDSLLFGKKDAQRKRSSTNNIKEKNNENEKMISSYNADLKKFYDLIPKITTYNNLSRNRYNNSNIFAISNSNNSGMVTNKINIDNIKSINKNFAFTMTNFHKKHNKIFNKFKYNKYSPRFYLQKNDDALKRRQLKFKNNFNNQVSKLNQYTNKCNTELIKLIDGNNDDNYKERKTKIINKTKLDMKEILIDKNKTIKKSKNEIVQKMKEKDTVKNLIKTAIYDIGDNFGEIDPKKKEKVLKKKINHISDEQALEMIEDIIEKPKKLDMKEIIGNDEKLQIKSENNMKSIRQKAANNYEKMLKLTNMIQIDKGKIFK